MSKKKIGEDEEMEAAIDNDYVAAELESESEELLDDDILLPEDDTLDLILEVSDEAPTEDEDVVLSKHKMQGKHSLKYDSIFKGKKEEKLDEMDSLVSTQNETFKVDTSSLFYTESYDSEHYVKQKRVREKVYEVLNEHTTINFLNNRRKPSKADFNEYFALLKEHLREESFTNVELFNELSVYFSDNLFNMFKLLDNRWRNLILVELREHIGKSPSSKEIMNRNIHLGTEVEFLHYDVLIEEERHYTGVIIDTNYEESIFKIDSYENVYEVPLTLITKILNNTKFKHNLNKLDNIDFL